MNEAILFSLWEAGQMESLEALQRPLVVQSNITTHTS